MKTATRSCFAVLLVLVAPALAEAQAGNGAFRLQLHGGVFETRSVTYGDSDDELESSTQLFGLLAAVGGVAVGFQLGDLAMIGTHFAFATQTDEPMTGDEDASASSVSFVPYFELLLAPGSTVSPYVQVGLGYTNTTVESGGTEASQGGLAFLGSFGLHVFATPSFSLSPSLYVRHVSGSLEVDSTSLDRSELAFGVLLGLGGWIGGDSSDAAGPSEEERRWVEEDYAGTANATSGAAAPSSGVRTDPDNVVTRVALDGAGLELVGRPMEDGQVVVLAVSHLVLAPTLRGCEEVRLVADGATLTLRDLRYESRPSGRGMEETVLVPAPRSGLERIPQASHASIDVCSERFVLTPFARARVGSFLERFRREALAYDTLEMEDEPEAGAPDAGTAEPERGGEPLDGELPDDASEDVQDGANDEGSGSAEEPDGMLEPDGPEGDG